MSKRRLWPDRQASCRKNYREPVFDFDNDEDADNCVESETLSPSNSIENFAAQRRPDPASLNTDPMQSDTVLDYKFLDGDEELKDLPQHLLDQLKLNCQRFNTRSPSCAQPVHKDIGRYLHYVTDGKPIGFVVPQTNKFLPAARYVSETLGKQIMVVRCDPVSWLAESPDQRNILPRIVVSTRSQRRHEKERRFLWYFWDPQSEFDGDDDDFVHVEQIGPGSRKKPKRQGRKRLVVQDLDDEDDRTIKRSRLAPSSPNITTSLRPSHGNRIPDSSVGPQTGINVRATQSQLQPASSSEQRLPSDLVPSAALPCTPASSVISPPTSAVKVEIRIPNHSTRNAKDTPSPRRTQSGLHTRQARSFVFQSSADGADGYRHRIPVSEISTPRDLFDNAICSGVATVDTTILKVRFRSETTWVAKKYGVYFERLLDRVASRDGNGGADDVVVMKAE